MPAIIATCNGIELKNDGVWLNGAGCGCCGGPYKATEKNLEEAIEEVEYLLEQLKAAREHV